jgi:hypothetical protein
MFDFIDQNCSKSFINGELKKHRENVLLERQKALIPETQPHVERTKELMKIEKEIKEINLENDRLQYIIHQNRMKIQELRRETYNTKPIEKKKFIRKCPIKDCRGFLSTQWKCGLCEKHICNKCNEEKPEDEHTCNPENVQTMELLNKDTKPCPKCGTMIHKISGCSQIWCIECHTAWDWNKGIIETGNIHNPHYYEFLRKQNNGVIPRNPGDDPCANQRIIPNVFQIIKLFDLNKREKVLNLHQLTNHISYTILNRVYNDQDELQLRIRYLMTNMSDEDFKKILQQKEKQRLKSMDFRHLYNMFVQTSIVKFHEIIEKKKYEETDELYFENLIEYFNNTSKSIGKKYDSVFPNIKYEEDTFKIVSLKK